MGGGGSHMIPGKVYGCVEFQKFSWKLLIIHEKQTNQHFLLLFDNLKETLPQIKQQLKVQIEEEREAPWKLSRLYIYAACTWKMTRDEAGLRLI